MGHFLVHFLGYSLGFSLDSFRNKRAAALLRSRESQIYSAHPVERLLRILEALSFWYARLYWFVKCLTIFLPSSKFVTLCPPQGIFALQKSLRAGCDGGRGPHRRGGSPRAKKFPEEICFAPSRVLQICRTPDYRVLKSTQYAQLVQPSVPGSSGVPEGPRPSVWEGVQR